MAWIGFFGTANRTMVIKLLTVLERPLSDNEVMHIFVLSSNCARSRPSFSLILTRQPTANSQLFSLRRTAGNSKMSSGNDQYCWVTQNFRIRFSRNLAILMKVYSSSRTPLHLSSSRSSTWTRFFLRRFGPLDSNLFLHNQSLGF